MSVVWYRATILPDFRQKRKVTLGAAGLNPLFRATLCIFADSELLVLLTVNKGLITCPN